MPTYEYACEHCHRKSEFFQRMKEPPKKKCPYCSKYTLKRLISGGAGVIFKGEGFYETDYKRKENAPPKEKKNKKKAGDP
jgi:putative FmdB family regulatory protein